ncbi:NADH-quinone oxidoreductase subunit C [Neisseriaceae bacterium PsAf]|nr:NADH-quinone oxidoreductase subunit C [Neisseriaceae bacterium PsAf]MCV2502547.1 NADH-quinone oxidoreductase subunit C [Neisseriaceae bacterium]
MSKLSDLKELISKNVDGLYEDIKISHNEITIECNTKQYFELMKTLRDNAELAFDQLMDLCGIDYSEYKNEIHEERIYAVVVHLLSISKNHRVRVKVFIDDNAVPRIDSVVELYSSANWYEREAFDMYGIIFNKHPDLRRILTDYGFIGHPLRKDFPVSGLVEMIFDEKENRVIYQPITIEPRNNVPRVVREEDYGA